MNRGEDDTHIQERARPELKISAPPTEPAARIAPLEPVAVEIAELSGQSAARLVLDRMRVIADEMPIEMLRSDENPEGEDEPEDHRRSKRVRHSSMGFSMRIDAFAAIARRQTSATCRARSRC